MAQETWTTRDLPVLDWLVDHFNSGGHRVSSERVATAVGLDLAAVQMGLKFMHETVPPFVKGQASWQSVGLVTVTGVTERALTVTGAWPSAEGFADRLVARLDEEADREPDPERKSKLQQTARYLGGAARDVVVDFAATYAARQAGPYPVSWTRRRVAPDQRRTTA